METDTAALQRLPQKECRHQEMGAHRPFPPSGTDEPIGTSLNNLVPISFHPPQSYPAPVCPNHPLQGAGERIHTFWLASHVSDALGHFQFNMYFFLKLVGLK